MPHQADPIADADRVVTNEKHGISQVREHDGGQNFSHFTRGSEYAPRRRDIKMSLRVRSIETSQVLSQQNVAWVSRTWEAEFVQYLLEESKWLCEEIDSGRITFQQACQQIGSEVNAKLDESI
jgi:hypothetical protein